MPQAGIMICRQSTSLIFGKTYNRHLIELIKHIPAASLHRQCKTNEPEPVTLEWLIEDYVKHMEYHLKQITAYLSSENLLVVRIA